MRERPYLRLVPLEEEEEPAEAEVKLTCLLYTSDAADD